MRDYLGQRCYIFFSSETHSYQERRHIWKRKKQTKKTNLCIEVEQNILFLPKWFPKTTKETGCIRRERKIDACDNVLGAAMWFRCSTAKNTCKSASMVRRYRICGCKPGVVIYERFNPELVVFLHICVMYGIVQPAEVSSLASQEKLSRFKDKLLPGSTIIRLPE